MFSISNCEAVMAEFPSVPNATVRPGDDRNLPGMLWEEYDTWGGVYLTAEPAPEHSINVVPATSRYATGDGLDIPDFLRRDEVRFDGVPRVETAPPVQFDGEDACEAALSE
jgi:hypothetical protein